MDKARPNVRVSLAVKCEEAIAYLGENYVLHPRYQTNPRHSTNPASYIPARAPYILAVKIAAEADRLHHQQGV